MGWASESRGTPGARAKTVRGLPPQLHESRGCSNFALLAQVFCDQPSILHSPTVARPICRPSHTTIDPIPGWTLGDRVPIGTMGKKKRGHPDVEELLARPWCYYCPSLALCRAIVVNHCTGERDFEDLKLLISHQKAKHFKCDRCGRRLNTAGGRYQADPVSFLHHSMVGLFAGVSPADNA